MKNRIPLILVALMALWPIGALIPKHDEEGKFAFKAFGSLPVLTNGRVQPLDSLARNSMLQMYDKQTLEPTPWVPHSGHIPATQWQMEIMINKTRANTPRVFGIDHPHLKGLLSLPME